MKLSEVLRSPDQWCKGDTFQDANGSPINHYDPNGKCCLYVACLAASPTHADDLYNELFAILVEGDHEGPIKFNDHPSTTFTDIQQLIHKLENPA